MTNLIDSRNLTDEQCEAVAGRIRVAKDFELPKLQYFNSSPCRKHRFGWEDEDGKKIVGKPKTGCQTCGIIFRQHQRVGIAWLYFKRRGLLADVVGSGKSASAAGLIAILAQTGELNADQRVLICVRPAAIGQWARELNRMLPNLAVITASGSRKARLDAYVQPWQVCLIGPQVLLNDEAYFDNFPLCLFVADDMDALRHPTTKTACAIKRIGKRATRMVIMSGTPLQKKLHELHSVLDPIGGLDILGSRSRFERRYVKLEWVQIWNSSLNRVVKTKEIISYRNLGEFSQLISPLALRRTADDIEDVNLPAVVSNPVYLDLYPRQTEKYEQLRSGVVEILRKGAKDISHIKAANTLHMGAQICGGLSLLGEADGPGTSVKLDWIMEQLQGDLSDEKVVIFIFYKDGVRSLEKRLQDAGIGYGIIWGEDTNKDSREATRNRFWNDPPCRVLLGTTAIEQSLNLQCARHIICVDTIMNPGRVEQLVGRIRRDGSAYKTVYAHMLYANNTQEESYLSLLENEQALIDSVWQEDSPIFKSLDPLKLLALIAS